MHHKNLQYKGKLIELKQQVQDKKKAARWKSLRKKKKKGYIYVCTMVIYLNFDVYACEEKWIESELTYTQTWKLEYIKEQSWKLKS